MIDVLARKEWSANVNILIAKVQLFSSTKLSGPVMGILSWCDDLYL